MAQIIEFETPRLRLRQWRTSDRLPFYQLNADPETMAFFPNPLSQSESNALALRCETLIDENGWGFWAVEIPEQAPFIGFVGLHRPSADLPFKPCVEIGWRLSKAFWGNGYATEAAQGALKIGFQQLQCNEIVSFTSLLNVRSQAVMERLQMIRDPKTFLHPSLPPYHPLQEHCLYRLSNQQWQMNQSSLVR